MTIRQRSKKGERGQVLIMTALCLVILLLMVGLAIDFGMAFVTRAQLGKAVDAAALTGAKNLQLGQAQATALAQSAFAMNYPDTSLNATPPAPNISYSTDSNGNKLVNVNVDAAIDTSFLGLVPGMSTVNVSSSAQAVEARVAMTLVLDRTGSMKNDGGSAVLPNAVTNFIKLFDNTDDTVEELSFANNVTINVPMQTGNFQQPIINAVDSMAFAGPTWSEGAMQQALMDETTGLATQVGNILHVVVFFTDGNANMVKDVIENCGSGSIEETGSQWNLGGYDAPSTEVGYLVSGAAQTNPTCPGKRQSWQNCCINGTFNSHLAGSQEPITWANISGPNGDGRYRVIQLANQMRAQNVIVYAIGLGSATQPVDPSFLCQVANDPVGYNYNCAPYYNNNSLPAGIMAWAQTPDQLTTAFAQVAADIHLRLTQ